MSEPASVLPSAMPSELHLVGDVPAVLLIDGDVDDRNATASVISGQFTVHAAMREHHRFRANPLLLKRHAVAVSEEPENLSLVASVVKSLGGLRARLARMTRFAHRIRVLVKGAGLLKRWLMPAPMRAVPPPSPSRPNRSF